MIWGWLAFLLSPATVSWKEDKSANNSTNIEVVFISSTAEPHWSDLQSWNLPRAMENDLWSLYKNSWSRACKHCHHRILNHWNVNINARFAPTVNQQTTTLRFYHNLWQSCDKFALPLAAGKSPIVMLASSNMDVTLWVNKGFVFYYYAAFYGN